MKSGLSSQLSQEIVKSIHNNDTFIDARNIIEMPVSMVKMAYGLAYKHEDSMVAINLIDAQLEQDVSQQPFAREQERFEMMRVMNEVRVDTVEYRKGEKLDLELLLTAFLSGSRLVQMFSNVCTSLQSLRLGNFYRFFSDLFS